MNLQIFKVLNRFVIFAEKRILIRLFMHQVVPFIQIMDKGKVL